jgi:hypothetical protein
MITDEEIAALKATHGPTLRRYDDAETGDTFFFARMTRAALLDFERTRYTEPQTATENLAKATLVWPLGADKKPDAERLDDYFEESPAAAAILAATIFDANAVQVTEVTERDGFATLLAQYRKLAKARDPETGEVFVFRKARRSEFAAFSRPSGGDLLANDGALSLDCMVYPEKSEGFTDREALTRFFARRPTAMQTIARAIINMSGTGGKMAPVGN